MPADGTKPLPLFQVRLTEAEKRRIKVLAVSQGLTLRQATVQAYEAWAAQLQSPGTTVDTDLEKPGQSKRGSRVNAQESGADPRHEMTPRQDRRPPERGSTPRIGHVPNEEGPARAWLRRAAQLDWSKCPAVESAQGRSGKRIWVVRGTDAPLAEVMHAVSEGHPLLEIAKVFEITLQQLIAVLHFAAEVAAPAGPAR